MLRGGLGRAQPPTHRRFRSRRSSHDRTDVRRDRRAAVGPGGRHRGDAAAGWSDPAVRRDRDRWRGRHLTAPAEAILGIRVAVVPEPRLRRKPVRQLRGHSLHGSDPRSCDEREVGWARDRREADLGTPQRPNSRRSLEHGECFGLRRSRHRLGDGNELGPGAGQNRCQHLCRSVHYL